MRIRPSQKKAFTLIELLIVIAIIGILAVAMLPSVLSGPASARNVIRKKALLTLQAVIELYKDNTGSYPSTSGAWWYENSGHPTDYIPNLVPDYVKILPRDPMPNVQTVCGTLAQSGYLYRSDGTYYKLLSHCAYEGTYPTSSEQFYDPARPTWALMVCNANPAICSGL